jgi:hypothetical protein
VFHSSYDYTRKFNAVTHHFTPIIGDILTTLSSGDSDSGNGSNSSSSACAKEEKVRSFPSAFKNDFLVNGLIDFFKLRTPEAHVPDYCLAENEKSYEPF